ncbi:MAG TPA: ABC transporter ATP-binding protein [Candidatus Fraserbacteria bacterium]|nr:ABC transporter ATP-binding protein [Candidatus Fraserbacteria bacterium]
MARVVKAEHLSKVYRMGQVDVEALHDVSLALEEGELIAIMGPSGSGKSTLMHLIGCLDQPTSGELIVNGEKVSQLNDRELARLRGRAIGFVFQTFNLIPRVNALTNVLMPMGFTHLLPPREREERARSLLEQVGLGSRLKHMPSELSGGERQRVAIARALANDPKLILADEPTGNLDTKSGAQIMELFDQLNERGHTIVVVTHDPNIAQHAQRIVHLLDGRVQDASEVSLGIS